ncbi:MAG: OmpA family protein [Rhodospirillales bacterium]|jgi:outer membrane protein OmpA-like peptidoglycan-associated protein|nr:OmpA family protein [Rhodospirillales bacterium]MDP6805817.1 OmpA family protein [Rhodospirillales bacterium]
MTLEPGSSLKLTFAADAAKLTEPVQEELIALAAGLKDRDGLRVQLLAYAGGESLSSSKARRLSLSRALAVRSLLIDNGVRSTRIDVRALGNKTTEEPVNRVDVIVAER